MRSVFRRDIVAPRSAAVCLMADTGPVAAQSSRDVPLSGGVKWGRMDGFTLISGISIRPNVPGLYRVTAQVVWAGANNSTGLRELSVYSGTGLRLVQTGVPGSNNNNYAPSSNGSGLWECVHDIVGQDTCRLQLFNDSAAGVTASYVSLNTWLALERIA